MESFLKPPFIILDTKTLPQINFQVVNRLSIFLSEMGFLIFLTNQKFLKMVFLYQRTLFFQIQLVLGGIKNC